MRDSVTFSVFADLHWREGDWSSCEARLDAIVGRALRAKVEFVIHCGDFCHDVAGYESRRRLAARGVPVLDGIADLPAHFGLAPIAAPAPLR